MEEKRETGHYWAYFEDKIPKWDVVFYNDSTKQWWYGADFIQKPERVQNFKVINAEETISLAEYTPEEQEIASLLVAVHNRFIKIPKQHPDETPCWVQNIHSLQQLMGMRILRRHYPEYFSIHSPQTREIKNVCPKCNLVPAKNGGCINNRFDCPYKKISTF